MTTHWNGEKDMTIKKKVTKEIVRLFPDCKGKQIMLMTSTSCNDLRELIEQGKIDESTVIYDVDNLSSVQANYGESRKDAFLRNWRKKSGRIFAKCGIGSPRMNFIFRNVFSIPLNLHPFTKRFSLAYIDTCNVSTGTFFEWLNSGTTWDGIEDGGTLAFTAMIVRKGSSILEQPMAGSSSVIELMAPRYSSEYIKCSFERKMNAMRGLVEGDGKWKVQKMIQYCESNNLRSQMATVVCKKLKRH